MSDQSVKVKGVADIVFVLDLSSSMNSIKNSLKTHIGDFIDNIINGVQSTLKDVRLGLVLHGARSENKISVLPLTFSLEKFNDHLLNTKGGLDEFGLPAVDAALDLQWRDNARRYIVFFSDEAVETGFMPDLQIKYLRALAIKMSELHIHFIGFNTKQFPSYAFLGKTPGSSYTVLEREAMIGVNMNEVLMGIAKTVTNARDSQAKKKVKKNIYKL